jgi:hypothetical protein
MTPHLLSSACRRARACLKALLCVGAFAIALANTAHAQTQVQARYEVEGWMAARTQDASLQLNRLTVKPTVKVNSDTNWRAELGLKLIVAKDDVGLGRTDGFSPASKPVLSGEDAALTVERAVLIHQTDNTEFTLGKQSVAWGSLDGLQVVDRFDPQRRVDFILSDPRPDRLSRWGARLKLHGVDSTWDLAVALDPSVSQMPTLAGAFLPQQLKSPPAPGAGMPSLLRQNTLIMTALPLIQSDRNDYIDDATFGVRYERRFQGMTANLVAISGPDTEPVSRLDISPRGPALSLDYRRRNLIGASAERPLGAHVLRVEAALIPDQPTNLASLGAPLTDTRARSLLGVGVDWNAPADVFVNAQIMLDHIDQTGGKTQRAETEAFTTLSLQRSFNNEAVRAKLDLAANLTKGDGMIRPSFSWQVNDTVSLSSGVDLFVGDRDGVLGQYRDESRGWIKLSATF